jgi:O-antigen/teichoic acid export membrane protein
VPVFGEDFRPATNLSLILLPGAAAIAVTGVLTAIVVGRGNPAYAFFSAAVTAPATVLLYATLIPAFDATGAALASTISYLGSLLVMSWLFRRATGRGVWSLLVPTQSEFDDLRGLPRSFAAKLGGQRR